MEELNRKVPQLPWIVAAIGIVIAGYFFMSASKVDTEILDRQNEITACKLKLEQYEKLETAYGRASERYYADKPLLILRPEGSEGRISIFWDSGGKKDATAKMSPVNNLELKWADKFNSQTHLADIIVVSKKNTGCYPITLSDNISNDKFQVLVVVK